MHTIVESLSSQSTYPGFCVLLCNESWGSSTQWEFLKIILNRIPQQPPYPCECEPGFIIQYASSLVLEVDAYYIIMHNTTSQQYNRYYEHVQSQHYPYNQLRVVCILIQLVYRVARSRTLVVVCSVASYYYTRRQCGYES